MNESEKHELQTMQGDIAKRDKELKDMLLQLQESLKRSQKSSTLQWIFSLGCTIMVVGMTLTGLKNYTQGLVIFFIGTVCCLITRFYLLPRVKR